MVREEDDFDGYYQLPPPTYHNKARRIRLEENDRSFIKVEKRRPKNSMRPEEKPDEIRWVKRITIKAHLFVGRFKNFKMITIIIRDGLGKKLWI